MKDVKFLSLYISAGGAEEVLVLIVKAVIQILLLILRVIFYAVIVGAIISWVSPNSTNPFLQLIEEISHKALSPIRKYIPSAGGLDFSPLFILILLNVLVAFLINLFSYIA